MKESKWIDKDVQNIIKKKIKDVQRAQKELTDDEIQEIMPEVVAFFKEHINDKEVYKDDKGGSFLLIKVPENVKPTKMAKMNRDDPDEEMRGYMFCGTRLGSILVNGGVSFWKSIIPGNSYFVRGKLNIQYDITGTWGTGKYTDSEGKEHKKFTKQQYFKTLELACKKTGFNEEELDEDDIIKNYTFNAWQNMG